MSGDALAFVLIGAGVMAMGGGLAAVIINPAFWPTRWLIWGFTLAIEFVCFAAGISLLIGALGIAIAVAVAIGDGVMLSFLQRSLRLRYEAEGVQVE